MSGSLTVRYRPNKTSRLHLQALDSGIQMCNTALMADTDTDTTQPDDVELTAVSLLRKAILTLDESRGCYAESMTAAAQVAHEYLLLSYLAADLVG